MSEIKSGLDQSGGKSPTRIKSANNGDKAHKVNSHNLGSILMRLTGRKFEDFSNIPQLQKAIIAVEKALFTERKKARMKRFDYDFNRHIAMHQANKALVELCRRLSEIQ